MWQRMCKSCSVDTFSLLLKSVAASLLSFCFLLENGIRLVAWCLSEAGELTLLFYPKTTSSKRGSEHQPFSIMVWLRALSEAWCISFLWLL